MLDWLSDPDPAMRLMAMQCVCKAKTDLGHALPKVAERLEDEREEVWRVAICELGKWGPEAIPCLLGITENKQQSAEVRVRAAEALTWQLKDRNPQVLAAIRQALREGPAAVRRELIWYLREDIGDGPRGSRGVEVFLPDLLGLLQEESDREVLVSVAVTIGSFGSKAQKAVSPLLKALGDRRTRGAAALALKDIHPKGEAVIDKLVEQLGDKEDVQGMRGVMDALRSYGPASAPAVPALIEMLKGPTDKAKEPQDQPIRSGAIAALGGIGKEAKATVPLLMAIVKDAEENAEMRRWVSRVLVLIDPQAGKAAQAFLKSQRLPSSGLRSDAP
jgi:HEAT repeat protein